MWIPELLTCCKLSNGGQRSTPQRLGEEKQLKGCEVARCLKAALKKAHILPRGGVRSGREERKGLGIFLGKILFSKGILGFKYVLQLLGVPKQGKGMSCRGDKAWWEQDICALSPGAHSYGAESLGWGNIVWTPDICLDTRHLAVFLHFYTNNSVLWDFPIS